MTGPRTVSGIVIALAAAAGTTVASAQEPVPNVPAPGEPRAQEQLPEAPPEEVLKSPPPIKKNAPPSPEPAKPAPPLPNTLPPAQKVEPKVPNT